VRKVYIDTSSVQEQEARIRQLQSRVEQLEHENAMLIDKAELNHQRAVAYAAEEKAAKEETAKWKAKYTHSNSKSMKT
jgi:TolA-binding protein